jgi:hypothetical protein
MSITIRLPQDLEHRLYETSLSQGQSAEQIVVEALSDRLRNHDASQNAGLSREENELLAGIHLDVTEADTDRFLKLAERLEAETMTEAEQQEFLSLNQRREAANVERLRKLVRLAQLRGKSLDEVMTQLGLLQTSHG